MPLYHIKHLPRFIRFSVGSTRKTTIQHKQTLETTPHHHHEHHHPPPPHLLPNPTLRPNLPLPPPTHRLLLPHQTAPRHPHLHHAGPPIHLQPTIPQPPNTLPKHNLPPPLRIPLPLDRPHHTPAPPRRDFRPGPAAIRHERRSVRLHPPSDVRVVRARMAGRQPGSRRAGVVAVRGVRVLGRLTELIRGRG